MRKPTCSSSLLKIVAVLSAPPVKMRLVLLELMSKAKIPGTEAECNPGCEAKVLNLKSLNIYFFKLPNF